MDPPSPPFLPPAESGNDAPPGYAWAVLVILSCLSGIFSGLNLGLMSLTVEDLNIVINSSNDPQQVRNAKKILPLRKRGNLLLCSLLIGNTVVNVMLSVLTDDIWVFLFGEGIAGTVLGLVVPSMIIVIFGEIVPQSVCSRYALAIGAFSLPLTYFFVIAFLPVSVPIAAILDKALGAEVSGVYTRQGLIELVKLNVESVVHAKESGLTKEDAQLLGGALTFKDKLVNDVMTPIERVYSLPIDTVLDRTTFLGILEKGHTRIPVYEDEPDNVIAILLAKNLLGIGYDKGVTLRYVLDAFHKHGSETKGVLRVSKATKLNVALEICKHNHVHMLVVTEFASEGVALSSRSPATTASARASKSNVGGGTGPVVGIVTIEDFLEEILQEEIVDETDVYVDNLGEISVKSGRDSGRDDQYPSSTKLSTPASDTAQLKTSTREETNAGERSPRMLKRLNSKHFDTTVVLRQLTDHKASAPA